MDRTDEAKIPVLIIFERLWWLVIRKGSWVLEESKCHSYLPEGQVGGCRKLQASHPLFDSWDLLDCVNGSLHILVLYIYIYKFTYFGFSHG